MIHIQKLNFQCSKNRVARGGGLCSLNWMEPFWNFCHVNIKLRTGWKSKFYKTDCRQVVFLNMQVFQRLWGDSGKSAVAFIHGGARKQIKTFKWNKIWALTLQGRWRCRDFKFKFSQFFLKKLQTDFFFQTVRTWPKQRGGATTTV